MTLYIATISGRNRLAGLVVNGGSIVLEEFQRRVRRVGLCEPMFHLYVYVVMRGTKSCISVNGSN